MIDMTDEMVKEPFHSRVERTYTLDLDVKRFHFIYSEMLHLLHTTYTFNAFAYWHRHKCISKVLRNCKLYHRDGWAGVCFYCLFQF